MQRWESIKNRVFYICVWSFSLIFGVDRSVVANPVTGFPTADPEGLAKLGQGKWLDMITYYVKQGGTLIGLALSVLAFVWVGYAALTKFNEAREGRAEWAELGVLAAAGAVILIFIAILLSQVGTAIKT